MKKTIIVVATIMAACIILTGIFSAGLVVGGLIIADRNQSIASQLTSNPSFSVEQEADEANNTSLDQPSTQPEEEEKNLLSELNPFDSDERQDPAPPEYSATPDELEDLFKPFWEAWDIVNEYYVDQPIDRELLMRGAIQGMLDSIGDQYTTYMDPESVEMFSIRYDGEDEYEGIGAWVDISKDYLTIISPFPGSPAYQAGLKPGDQIIAVNGEDMTGVDGELVRQQVMGPAGTTITITILRSGYEPFDVDVTRANVVVPSIESYMMDGDIAYIRLILFGATTSDELKEALETLFAENPKGLILDLRYNGGGYLRTAVEVASEFIEEGKIVVHEEYGDGSRATKKAIKNG